MEKRRILDSPFFLFIYELVTAPFFQIGPAKLLHSGDVFFLGDGKQGVVEKIFPVYIAAEDVAGPGSASLTRRASFSVWMEAE